MRLGIVEWTDSQAFTGWHDKNAELDISECVSVGIIQMRRDSIRITQSLSNHANVSEEIAIPRCAVKRIRYLKMRGAK